MQQIAELQEGSFGGKVDDLFTAIVKAVSETGKAGKLTITIDVKTSSGGMLSFTPKVTDKTPEPPVVADVFWPTEDGRLSRDNPKQRKLPLQQVADDKPSSLRSAEDSQGAPLRTAG
jgi:hypothetical protein